jgi:hypothetical protein
MLRHIGSFIPWGTPDFGSRARMVCRAMRDGVDDTARTIMLPAMHIPFVLAGASLWHKAMYSLHGRCTGCNASAPRMARCQHSGHDRCEAALCMPCADLAEQRAPPRAEGGAPGCPCCARWFCAGHLRRNLHRCLRCEKQACRECTTPGVCHSCVLELEDAGGGYDSSPPFFSDMEDDTGSGIDIW